MDLNIDSFFGIVEQSFINAGSVDPFHISINGQKFWHHVRRIYWENSASYMHLLINVTAAHELTLQKAANRYMRIMIGSITHELRTPLNSSINALTLLEENVLAAGLRHLKTAKTSNRLLSALIEDILDLTRLEAGEFRLQLTRFRLRVIVELIDELFCD